MQQIEDAVMAGTFQLPPAKLWYCQKAEKKVTWFSTL